MNIVVKDENGKTWPADAVYCSAERGGLVVEAQVGEDYIPDIPEEATVHLSTGMTDKNGREILCGDVVLFKGDEADVCFDGINFFVFDVNLTPELAATMEVVG